MITRVIYSMQLVSVDNSERLLDPSLDAVGRMCVELDGNALTAVSVFEKPKKQLRHDKIDSW